MAITPPSILANLTKQGLLRAAPLRYNVNLMRVGVWAKRAARYLGSSGVAPIYPWPVLTQRIESLSACGRNDQVAFFRHGTTNYNRRRLLSGQHNTLLTELGRDQAREISLRLPHHIDLIACSALARAIETMQLAVGEPRIKRTPVVVDPRLNEVNFGSTQGKSKSSLGGLRTGGIDYSPGNGENYRIAAARVFSFVVDLYDELEIVGGNEKSVVVFCHAGVLRMIATLIWPISSPEEMFEWRFENASRLDVCLGSIRLPDFWTEKQI